MKYIQHSTLVQLKTHMRVIRNTITFLPFSKVCFHHTHYFLEATNNRPDLIYCTLFRFNSIGIPDFTELLNLRLSVFSICNFLNQFGKKSPCFWKSHATQTTHSERGFNTPSCEISQLYPISVVLRLCSVVNLWFIRQQQILRC